MWQKVSLAHEQLDYFRNAQVPVQASEPPPAMVADLPYQNDASPWAVVWVRKADNGYEPWIPVWAADTPGEFYDVNDAYQKAQQRRRPVVSPHHHLREVGTGNVYKVLQFLRQHGTLTLDDLQEEPPLAAGADKNPELGWRAEDLVKYSSPNVAWLNLGLFWRRQERFATAYSLWDGRVDADRLRKTLMALAGQKVAALDEVWQDHGPMFAAGLGRKGGQKGKGPPARVLYPEGGQYHPGVLEQFNLPALQDWVPRAPYEQLALLADAFVHREINEATEGIRPTWISRFDWMKRRLALHFVLQPESLWAACWQMFGHDSVSGKIARVCPHCAKLFYPKRKEQIFCTSRLQQLFAKRRWAAANR